MYNWNENALVLKFWHLVGQDMGYQRVSEIQPIVALPFEHDVWTGILNVKYKA